MITCLHKFKLNICLKILISSKQPKRNALAAFVATNGFGSRLGYCLCFPSSIYIYFPFLTLLLTIHSSSS